MGKFRRKVILAGLMCLIVTFCIVGYNMLGRQKSNNRSMAIYIPNANGDGYTLSNYTKIPTGYMLNETESYCNNGSVLSWVNDGISISSTRSDACHIYLDEKADPIAVGTNTLTFTDNKIKINKTFNTSTEESIEKYFTIETGNSAGIVDMYFEDLKNTYLFGSLQYTLSYATSENGTYTNIVEDKYVPINTNSEGITKVLEKQLKVPANSTYYYKLKIQYVKWTYRDQSADANASLNTKFTIVQGKDYDEYASKDRLKTTMKVNARTGAITYSNDFLISTSGYAYSCFDKILTHSSIDTSASTNAWDISENQNGSVMAWVTDCKYDDEADETYDCVLHIGQEGGVIANTISKNLFKDFKYVTEIDLSNFDTALVQDYSQIFYGNTYIKNLYLGPYFDTYNATTLNAMFYNCTNLQSLNLEMIDTSNVTDMSFMFDKCMSLVDINVSSFDTYNVTTMKTMFGEMGNGKSNTLYSTVELDISHFDTRKVTDMSYMFYYSYNFKKIDISNFIMANNIENLLNRAYLQELRLDNVIFENATQTSNVLNNTFKIKENLQIYVNQSAKNFIETNFPIYSDNLVLV